MIAGLKIPVGVALLAVLALAGLLGIFAFNAAAPTEAQSAVQHSGDVREHSTDSVPLAALEPDRTQIADRWELVTDTNDPAGAPDTVDHRLFEIDRMSGVLTFKSPPDYEDPKSAAAADASDLAAKNVYKVKAKFGDGEKYLTVEVTVRVTNIEEDGSITLSNRRPQVEVPLQATLADPDKGIRTPDWQWEVETGEGTGQFVDIARAVNRTYTPKAGDVGKRLKATATYQDGYDINYDPVSAVSEFAVRPKPDSNEAPEFREEDEDDDTDGMQTSRRIEENSAPGTMVGPALFATDDDHKPAGNPGGEPRDEITYSLRDPTNATPADGNDSTTDDDNDPNTPSDRDGHAAMFNIDQATGQITTMAPLDRESLSGSTPAYTYMVVVKATDPSGAAGEATLTIHVLDMVETPQLLGAAAITYFENRPDATSNVLTTTDSTDGIDNLILHRDPTTDVDTADDHVTYMANDNDLDDVTGLTAGQIQWELTGDDAGAFQFGDSTATYTNSGAIVDADSTATPATVAVATSPVLRFRSAPDVEAPADVGGVRAGDNIYEIKVRAWDDDWLIGEREVTIRVADTDDLGMVTLSHVQPQQGVEIEATLNDPDGVSGSISWQWYTGAGAVDGSEITGATKATYTPPDAETGILSVKATYEDRGSRGQARTAMANTANAVRPDPIADDTGENDAPTFYVDAVDGTAIDLTTDASQRIKDNETSSYTRYVLEGQHPRNVRNTELQAREYADNTGGAEDATATVKVWDGFYADAAAKTAGTLTADGTTGKENLQFDLSGADAKYFEINPNPGSGDDPAGLIKTKQALDFETKNTYTVTVTATDPAGAKDTATVTINVLDQAEIEDVPGDEKRVWVNENKYFITELEAKNPPDRNLGGLKWSLLTTNEDYDATSNDHNRNSALSVDCEADETNDDLCDNFRFSRFHTTKTNLLFALGTGEKHEAPDFEDPQDRAGAAGTAEFGTLGQDATGQAMDDNVYQVRVRVAFATLRSAGPPSADNHPSPKSDEMEERTYVIRVVDVDEDPEFSGKDSNQSIVENSDDDLPNIDINVDLGGSVSATDPEDTTDPDPNKKLTFSFDDMPEAYADMFQIVPSTGEILTKSRIDYEALNLEEQGTPGGQYKTITGVTVKATDSDPIMQTLVGTDTMPTMVKSERLWAKLPVSINVRDVNETPVEATPLDVSGATAVNYAENGTHAVATYTARGDNAATATWTLGGADMALFELAAGANDMERMLRFKAAPDFEMPRGEAMSATNTNVYMVTITVMGGTAPDDETREVMVTVTVQNVEEPGTVTITPTGVKVGTELTAELTDADIPQGAPVWQWSRVANGNSEDIEDARAASYTPVVADVGHFLRATATYNDGFKESNTAYATTAIQVADANVQPKFAEPGMMVEVAENSAEGTNVGSPITATDDNGDALTYSLSGDDAMYFTIDNMGQIKVGASAMLDYEMKSSYMVTVTATDPDQATGTTNVTVNVTNVNEDGMVSLDLEHPRVGTTVEASVTDEDGITAGTVTWQWAYSTSMSGPFTAYTAQTRDRFTPRESDADQGLYLRVTATYTDAHGAGQTAYKTTGMVTHNMAPAFAADADNTRMVAEDTAAGAYIGAPVTATDADDSSLVYTLGGTDAASFGIGEGTGQLMTSGMLDYETKMTYMVTVTATDPYGASDTIMVTIMVENVDEMGTVSLSSMAPMVGEMLTASLTDPDGGITGTTWQWSKSMTMGGTFMAIAGATSMTYTPVEGDVGYYLRATASYTDNQGTNKSAMATSSAKVPVSDPLAKFDTNGTPGIQRDEVIAAINAYLSGGAGAPSRADVIALINRYLGS